MIRFNSPDMCGAWRCEEFSCDSFHEADYNCNNNLCHVCNHGTKCSSCKNFSECEEAQHNLKIQNEKENRQKQRKDGMREQIEEGKNSEHTGIRSGTD